MKTVCFFTGTRADYGLLAPLIEAVRGEPDFRVQIVAAGMHLSPEFGLTYRAIEDDGLKIDERVEMLLSSDTEVGIVKSTGLGMIGFADAFRRLNPDWMVILGDRFEAFAAAAAAFLSRIPIIHIAGGEVTEGATDDALRHSISKMAYLHFTATEPYRRRVIQLGESPDRVFHVGALGLDNIRKLQLLSRDELQRRLEFRLDRPYLLVTFHPVTLEHRSSAEQVRDLLDALNRFPGFATIFTLPNADADGRVIIELIQEFVRDHRECAVAYHSLGQLVYLSAMQQSAAVVGNSSSGIVEAPSFGIPTVNIGDRQRGRIRVGSILDCGCTTEEIERNIAKAVSPEFSAICRLVRNPYGDGTTAEQIVRVLRSINYVCLKKSFHDLDGATESK